MSSPFPSSISAPQSRHKGGRPTRLQRDLPSAVPPDTVEQAETDDAAAAGPSTKGPVLALGMPGEARLKQDEQGRWGWRWLKRQERAEKVELRGPKEIYPGQYGTDHARWGVRGDLDDMNPSLRRKASSQYLRNLSEAPDYEELNGLVSAEMDQLEADERAGAYDHFLGRRLAVLQPGEPSGEGGERTRRQMRAVLFPTGQVGQQLGIAVFLPSPKRGSKKWYCLPQAEPLVVFPTPVLQIDTAPTFLTEDRTTRAEGSAHLVLVRLHSSVQLYLLRPKKAWDPDSADPAVQVQLVAALGPDQLRGRRAIDCALDAESAARGAFDEGGGRGRARVVLADATGGVWLWEPEPGREQALMLVYTPKTPPAPADQTGEQPSAQAQRFYRIDFAREQDAALLLAEREAVIVSLAGPDAGAQIAVRLPQGSMFTALGRRGRGDTTLRCLATTQEVVWIDQGRPVQAVLRWKHECGAGGRRDLELSSLFRARGAEDLTVLSSRSDRTVLTYSVSRAPDLSTSAPQALAFPLAEKHGPLHSLCTLILPLPDTTSGDDDRLGQVTQAGTASGFALGLSPTGSVWAFDCDGARTPLVVAQSALPHQPDEPTKVDLRVKWDDNLLSLASKGGNRGSGSEAEWRDTWGEEGRDKAERRFWTIDARWAWLKINEQEESLHDEDDDEVSEGGTELLRVVAAGLGRTLRAEHSLIGHQGAGEEEEEEDSEGAKGDTGSRTAAEVLRGLLQKATEAQGQEAPAKTSRATRLRPLRLDLTSLAASDLAEVFADVERDIRQTGMAHRLEPFLDRIGSSASSDAAAPPASLQDVYIRLLVLCPPRTDLPEPASARQAASTLRLALDLWLSSIVRFAQPVDADRTAHAAQASTATGTPEDLVARMTIAEPGPPPIAFSYLRPSKPAQSASASASASREGRGSTLASDHPKQTDGPLQTLGARTLLADWTVGADPAEYVWKPYRPLAEGEGENEEPMERGEPSRPIRPLPGYAAGSARPTQGQTQTRPLHFATQPERPGRAYPATQVPVLQPRYGMEPGARAGSPLGGVLPETRMEASRTGSSQPGPGAEMGMIVQSQVERGPFGGRPEGKEKKKKAKKRAGGF